MSMAELIKTSDKTYFRQSYKITKASSRLSSAESNLVYIILGQINKEDQDFKEYHFTLTDLTKIMDKELNYSRLRDTAKKLCSNPILVENEEKSRFEIINWFSRFTYDKGVISCVLDSKLKEYLLEVDKERFSLVSLRYVLRLKGKYSKKLYILLKSEQFRGSFEIDLEELYSILKVPTTMQSFGEFHRKVFRQAQKDMSKFSDILFEVEQIKRARKVVSVRLHIKENHNDLNTFINHIRDNYVNTPLLIIKGKTLQVSTKGLLYYAEDAGTDKHDINKQRAYELWQTLFDKGKEIIPYKQNEINLKEIEEKLKNGSE